MKTLKHLTLLLMCFSLVTLSSCSDDDDGGDAGGGAAASGTITAKVNGASFTSMEITSTATKVSGGGQTTLTMQGNTESQAISMVINGYDGVGTYTLSDDNVFRNASYVEPNVSNPLNTQTWNAPYQDSGVIGEIKISEDTDSNIKGTFNFVGKNSNDDTIKEVTEGAFNLSVQIY
ncbi:DUF6252 family protein [Xanthomarina sp. F1114]|uniref:DUF6252 family protein n=1 Tax=Xanthomarina sp. F1114 TaxID=2996019 RepID=UPI00225E4B45|nr:DUF6252 family protein [Xanthomarina sp. F1114]MCX7548750.1 DUF6252 family protein [Xanthomarina sp. F1114]